jgi:hypothetical protein
MRFFRTLLTAPVIALNWQHFKQPEKFSQRRLRGELPKHLARCFPPEQSRWSSRTCFNVSHVHGVSYDGANIWIATGSTLNAIDPESGKTVCVLDVPAHAGTAFDGKHLF